MIKGLLGLLFTLIANTLSAQVFPAEGSRLHYRIIGFTVPVKPVVKKYSIEIALGNYTTERDFRKGKLLQVEAITNNIIVEVPYFFEKSKHGGLATHYPAIR